MDTFDFWESSSRESILSNLTPTCEINQQPTEWTMEENKLFQSALAKYHPDSPNFYKFVASRVPWKSIYEIKEHYQKTIEAVAEYIPVPVNIICDKEKPQQQNLMDVIVMTESASAPSQEVMERPGQERSRGIPWSIDEHNLFLMGLEKLGRGDWKTISRSYVKTKTTKQVASHAQKFFRRQNSSTPMDRRRPSIHDIQTVNTQPQSSLPQHQNSNNHPGNEGNLLPFQSPNDGLINPTISDTYNNGLGPFGNDNNDKFTVISQISCTFSVINNHVHDQAPEKYPFRNHTQNQVPEAHTLVNERETEGSGTYRLIKPNECFDTFHLQNQNKFSSSVPIADQNQTQSVEACPLMNQNEVIGTYPSINENEGFDTYSQLNQNQFYGACSTLIRNQNQGHNIKEYSLMNQNDGFDTYPFLKQNEYFSTFHLLNQNQCSGGCPTVNQNLGSEADSMYYGLENFGNTSKDQNCRIVQMNTELEVLNNHDQNQACDANMPYMLPFNGNNQWG